MALIRLSPQAEADIEAILAWTHDRFGEEARLRYEALLTRAIFDVAEDPDRPGSHLRPEIMPEARTYHLIHSRDRARTGYGKVHRPRHFLLYRTLGDDRIDLGRVLHDELDFARYLPDDYRA